MKTLITIAAIVCAFLAFTFVGFLVWCWLFSHWSAAPAWLLSPNYWAFTGCWLLLAFVPLLLLGLNGPDQEVPYKTTKD